MAEPLPSLCFFFLGRIDAKQICMSSGDSNRLFFFNYQLVVIKACCMYFTPCSLYLYRAMCQDSYGGCEDAITGGLPQRFWARREPANAGSQAKVIR